MAKEARPLLDRFLDKVEMTPVCWRWLGPINSKSGYACFNVNIGNGKGNKSRNAHRVAYELFVGTIPKGAHVHHKCHVKSCVNPAHLELLTPKTHLRLHADEITACPSGHPYDEKNTYIDKGGFRHCRTCFRIRAAATRSRNWKPPTPYIFPTHCSRGHEYTAENTYVYQGYRRCKECHRIRASKDWHRNKVRYA